MVRDASNGAKWVQNQKHALNESTANYANHMSRYQWIKGVPFRKCKKVNSLVLKAH